MRWLISADLSRLWQWGPFRLGGAFMAVYGICNSLIHFYFGGEGLEGLVLDFIIMLAYVQAIIAVGFIHEDHSSGGLKNKLAVGHSRGTVYMSHLLAQYLAGLIYAGLYILPALLLGQLLLGGTAVQAAGLLARLGCYTAVLLSFTAIYTLISLLISGNWIRVGSFVGVFLLLRLCTRLDYGLAIPETAPAYVREPIRRLYGLILDVTPAGEAIQLMGTGFRQPELWVLWVSALGVAFLAVICGLAGFLRKDIK